MAANNAWANLDGFENNGNGNGGAGDDAQNARARAPAHTDLDDAGGDTV